MRMAKLAEMIARAGGAREVDPMDFLLFPEDQVELSDELSASEKRWIARLDRMG